MMSNAAAGRAMMLLEEAVSRGARLLPGSFRRRCAGFIESMMRPDGGFAGRAGVSDIYYSSFAFRSARLLGIKGEAFSNKASGYIRSAIRLGEAAGWKDWSTVELYSLLAAAAALDTAAEGPGSGQGADRKTRDKKLGAAESCRGRSARRARGSLYDRLRETILDKLLEMRAAGGGFADRPGSSPSLYHTFLAVNAFRLLGVVPPYMDEAADFVLRCARPDGGFSDAPPAGCEADASAADGLGGGLAPVAGAQARPDAGRICACECEGRRRASETSAAAPSGCSRLSYSAWAGRSMTSRTAAAIALLAEAGRLKAAAASAACGFLASLQREDGGLPAFAGADESDLLSTFTGAAAAWMAGGLSKLRLGAAARFAASLEAPGGGFRGAESEGEADVEYTYYGIAMLALFADFAASARAALP